MLVKPGQLKTAGSRRPDGCEFFADSPGHMIVRPTVESLDASSLQGLLQRLDKTNMPDVTYICLDLSSVERLVGPWGGHSAILISASRRMSLAIGLTGLRGQPTALAWLFRDSPEVRDLLRRVPVRRPASACPSDSRSAA